MMNFFRKSKKKVVELQEVMAKQEQLSKTKLKGIQVKLNLTQTKLKKIYEELVKPLFAEIKLKNETIEKHV